MQNQTSPPSDTKKIVVTQKHIDTGKREDCRLCPIALAIEEAFPSATNEVTIYSMVVQHKTYYCSRGLSNLIQRYDSGGNMPEIRIKLEDNTATYRSI